MKTYIALLRGINVAGQKKMPMKELKELLLGSGFYDVKTYIQSGNVVFNSSESEMEKITTSLEKLILDHFGFKVPILIKTPDQLSSIISKFPFDNRILTTSYFTLLHQEPERSLIDEVLNLDIEDEEFEIIGDCVYFYSAKGYGKAKANNNFFEKKLKVTATTRNYKTMQKLLTLST